MELQQQQQPPSWSHLPDVCLWLVFRMLPASDMAFSVGQVCANWARVQTDELRREHLWSCLPASCLQAVFKYIPLDSMIRSVGRVCTNWTRIQRVWLRNRRVLVIADRELAEEMGDYDNPYGSYLIENVLRDDGSPWAPARSLGQIELDTVLLPDNVLKESFTTPLMAILPNITHLYMEIYIREGHAASILEQMTRLINHYATGLVTLKLDGTQKRELPLSMVNLLAARNEIMGPLFDSINRLESLRHLRLSIPTLDTLPQLTNLARLATFACVSNRAGPSYLASLRQYPTRDDLRVEFGSTVALEDLVLLDRHLATKFIHVYLCVALAESHYEDMRKFGGKFASLQSLEIVDSKMPMTMLARALSLLPQLIHLDVQFKESEIPAEEQPPQLEPSQVPSVRLVSLRISTKSHHDTERLHLHQIFPNLQVLHLIHSSYVCGECDYNFPNLASNEVILARVAHCIQLARQPFRRCARLHTVELETEHDLNDLIPEGMITRENGQLEL